MKNRKSASVIILFVITSLVGNVLFSQVAERERPKEWDALVEGARFLDRFLPMKGEVLSTFDL